MKYIYIYIQFYVCLAYLLYQVAAMEGTIARLASELRQAPAPLPRGWHWLP